MHHLEQWETLHRIEIFGNVNYALNLLQSRISNLKSIHPIFHYSFSHCAQIVGVAFVNTCASRQDEAAPLTAHLNELAAILLDLFGRAGDQQ